MRISFKGILVPPLPIGQPGSSLIDLNPPIGQYYSVIHVPMENYMARKVPQLNSTPSIWTPPPQLQLSQGATFYPGGNQSFVPQPNIPYGPPPYMNVPPQQGGYYPMNPMYLVGNNMMGGPQGPSSHSSSPLLELGTPNSLPFLETLDIPDLYKITNDAIYHNLHWPTISHKIPFDISKFEGKQGDDLGTNVTTYHLWCVLKSMVDDSIRLRLFPHTLIGNASKWYIELPRASVNTFGAIAREFLNHFQLPISFKTRTKPLLPYAKTSPPTSLITSLNRDVGGVLLKLPI